MNKFNYNGHSFLKWGSPSKLKNSTYKYYKCENCRLICAYSKFKLFSQDKLRLKLSVFNENYFDIRSDIPLRKLLSCNEMIIKSII